MAGFRILGTPEQITSLLAAYRLREGRDISVFGVSETEITYTHPDKKDVALHMDLFKKAIDRGLEYVVSTDATLIGLSYPCSTTTKPPES